MNLLLGAFGLGAVLIAGASFNRPHHRSRLWTLYGLEIVQVAGIVVPTVLGSPWIEAACITLFVLCSRELWTCLKRAYASRAFALLLALAYPAAGCAAWYSLWRHHAASTVLFAFAVVELNDILAWALGSAFGKRKLWPTLSPNKTIVGCIGGIIGSFALGMGLGFLVPNVTRFELVVATALLSLLTPAGDLIASYWKRRARVKDYAGFIPYQGGVFDLYDSFLFAIPAFTLYLTCIKS